jgi:hypothetical protein
LNIDDYEEDENTSKSLSLIESEPSPRTTSKISSEGREIISRPLWKSLAFQDHDLLEQQVRILAKKPFNP